MKKDIDWLFFDMGSTPVDESFALENRVRATVAGSPVTCDQFFSKMLEFAHLNTKCYHAAADVFGLEKAPWKREEERLYPETGELLDRLSGQYRLGIIANQSPGAEKRLEDWGIRQYFAVIVSSAEEGVVKPDPEIFRRALARASCPPERSAMVGDRLDNDIAPAKALGMTTIWVKQGVGGLAEPKGQEETPDFAVEKLEDLIDLL